MRGQCLFTDDMEHCYICFRPAHGVHHLIFGSDRKNADEIGCYIPICDECHMLGHLDDKMGCGFAKESRIHDNPMAETLSKMLGQMAVEKHFVAEGKTEAEARIEFRKKFGRSFL